LVLVGLALVLVLQVALHLRLGAVPARAAAHLERAAEERASREANALQEAARKRVELIVALLKSYQEQAAEDWRAQFAASQQRAKLAEERVIAAAGIVSELRELAGDLRCLLAEQPARGAVEAAAPAASEADPEGQRNTMEMQRAPASCAPSEGTAPTQEEGDDSEERTHVLDVDAASVRAAVLRALPPPPPTEDEHASLLPPASGTSRRS
jgi:hypothetical protein